MNWFNHEFTVLVKFSATMLLNIAVDSLSSIKFHSKFHVDCSNQQRFPTLSLYISQYTTKSFANNRLPLRAAANLKSTNHLIRLNHSRERGSKRERKVKFENAHADPWTDNKRSRRNKRFIISLSVLSPFYGLQEHTKFFSRGPRYQRQKIEN